MKRSGGMPSRSIGMPRWARVPYTAITVIIDYSKFNRR